MKSIWETNYQNNQIKIINTWFNGERLYVNDELQDRKRKFFSSDLKGHIRTSAGEKVEIKANLIANLASINCILFVDDKEVKLTKVK